MSDAPSIRTAARAAAMLWPMATLSLACAGFAAPANASDPMVLAFYGSRDNNYTSLTTYSASYTAVSVDYYDITGDGKVTGNGQPAPADAISWLHTKKIPAYACVANLDGGGK